METRGVRVRFSSPAHENRYWWTIHECDERYVVCVRERLALPDGLLAYTVADRRNGTRGHVKDERSGRQGRMPSIRRGMAAGTGESAGDYRHRAAVCGGIQGEALNGFDHTGVTPAKHQNNAASDILTGWHEGMWV